MLNLASICQNGTFVVLDERTATISECFLHTFILVPFYSIFAVVNVYILASANDISRKINAFHINLIRILTFVLLIVSLIDIFNNFFMPASLSNSETMVLVSSLYRFVSLGIHFFNVLNKNIFIFFPIKLMISLTCLLLVNIVNFINLFYQRKHLKLYEILEASFTGVLFLYFLTIITTYKKTRLVVQISETSTENLIQEEEEEDHVHNDLRSEEDHANYFSYLTIGWLKPVMEK